jgi:hypothetical protein
MWGVVWDESRMEPELVFVLIDAFSFDENCLLIPSYPHYPLLSTP